MKGADKTIGVAGDTVKLGVVRKHQGCRMRMLTVKIVNLFEIDRGDNVGVDYHKGTMVPEIGNIFDGTAGTKDIGLISSLDRDRVGMLRDIRFDLGMPVVGIDDDRFATGSDQFEDHNIQERSALDGE
jgi:hypothetical protein